MLLNQLARLLAAHLDAQVRDGQQALRLARCAALLTRNQSVTIFDTLAMAQAETDQFVQAVETSQKALNLANPTQTAADITERLEPPPPRNSRISHEAEFGTSNQTGQIGALL